MADETSSDAAREGRAARLIRAIGEFFEKGRYNLLILVVFAALLYLPRLGAIGLWDPWETHYGEVAREMVERGDWIYPYWESSYFFSKPPFSMWMMAAGFSLVGVEKAPLSPMVDLAARLPFALTAIFGLVMLYLLASRYLGKLAGLLAGVALSTTPFYLFLARQAMTDIPFVSFFSAAIACLGIALFGDEGRTDGLSPAEKRRKALILYSAYVLMAAATLAKGFLGFLMPGVVFFAYFLVGNQWRQLLRMRIVTGGLLFLALTAPWIVLLSFFPGADDENVKFATRFFIHDHFKRIAIGVHTTTPGGTFIYFIEQLGFGAFPWIALLPAAIGHAVSVVGSQRPADGEKRTLLAALLWLVVGFVVFTLSITKFHHYIFPVVPAAALLVGYYLACLAKEEISPSKVTLLVALGLFIVVARDLSFVPRHLMNLFIYNYERPYPSELDPKRLFPVLFTTGGFAFVFLYLMGWKRFLPAAMAVLAVVFAFYLNQIYFIRMTPHWTQRHIFDTYWGERKEGEPVGAYMMNWRGETFYSLNTVKQLKSVTDLKDFVKPPGREFIVVEQSRYSGMQSSLGSPYREKMKILDRSTNKFYLVSVE